MDSQQRLVGQMHDLARYYMLSNNSAMTDCLPKQAIWELVRSRQRTLFDDPHVSSCPRCASLYASFQNIAVADNIPASFQVAIALPLPCRDTLQNEGFAQLLGKIAIGARRFKPCESTDDWYATLGNMRVNVVISENAELLSVSLLDVPDYISHIVLKTEYGDFPLAPSLPDGTFELVLNTDDPDSRDRLPFCSSAHCAIVFSSTRGHKSRDYIQARVLSALREVGAIETEYDYVLPSGLHCDTHINMARVCHSPATVALIAEAFDQLIPEEFETVVTNGWPLATIARQLARMRNGRNPDRVVREVLYEGYETPLPVEEIALGSKTVILTDVTVTGHLLSRLCNSVRSFGGHIVAVASVVAAKSPESTAPDNLRALCEIKIQVSKTGRTRRLEWREKRYFNPLTNCMTERKEKGRSPSEFYESDQNARTLWSFIEDVSRRTNDVARFYRRHKIIGSTHYTEYIDTQELLNDAAAQATLIESLRDILAERCVVPDVILAPKRKRALLLARLLQTSFGLSRETVAPVCFARKTSTGWELDADNRHQLAGQRVLIVDTAVGHGKTLDLLALLAVDHQAQSTAAAVILSRLSESCESALNDRLDGGFVRLFNLPIRPVVVRSSGKMICPVCQQRAAISGIAEDTRSEAIERLVQRRFARTPGHLAEQLKAEPGNALQQKSLFPTDRPRFISQCRPAIARGLTLHSLYAAKNNGMAPLSLPELLANDVPVRTKEAMVQDLPDGALSWSTGFLDQDLRLCLEQGTHGSVWSASAFVCAAEGGPSWRDHLAGMIERTPELRTRPQVRFWSRLACSAYLAAKSDSRLAEEMKHELSELSNSYHGTEAESGISRVVEAICAISAHSVD